MKRDLLLPFESFPYFPIDAFKQATGMENAQQVRLLLYRWSKAGHIVALKKGIYMTRRFYQTHGRDPLFLPMVSAVLLPQSYLSLEFILQRAGILTEVTYPVTAVTNRNTRRIVNSLGTFWYRSIQEPLYRGYIIREFHGVRIAEASLAKALFDFLYLRPIPAELLSPAINLAEELRLNLEEFAPEARQEFLTYVELNQSPKMGKVLESLERHTWQP